MTGLLIALLAAVAAALLAVHTVHKRARHGLAAAQAQLHVFAQPADPPTDRSLDNTCLHHPRPVSVVPHGHTTPEAWLCPDCYATVPEPAPLGPTPSLLAQHTITTGTIDASTFTTGTFTLGPAAMTVLDQGMTVGRRGYDSDPGEDAETYEVFSHQSATPVRTFTTGGRDVFRDNLAAFMREAGHPPDLLAARLADYDRRHTTADPVRVNTGRGWPIDPNDDTRPL